MLTALANESVALGALISAICVAIDLPEEWMNVILAAVPLILGLLIRQVTTSPGTLVDGLLGAATETATELGTTTVGAVGTLTERGETIAHDTVRTTLRRVGGLAAKLGRGILD